MNNALDANFIPKMFLSKVLLVLCIILLDIKLSYGLECYVCDNQEDNDGKCVNTIKTCQQEEDVCLTEVKWGSRPYWSQGAQKQFYISKRCSNKERCRRHREANMKYCTYIWYEDWKCSDCCKGDRCNYYIISAAYKNSIAFIPLITSTVLLFYYKSYS